MKAIARRRAEKVSDMEGSESKWTGMAKSDIVTVKTKNLYL